MACVPLVILYLTKFNIALEPIKSIFVYLKHNFKTRKYFGHQLFIMNTTPTKFSFKKTYALIAMATMALISACGKDDTPVLAYGSFSVYNTSPTLATYDVYLNGSKLNSAALPYAGGVKYSQLVAGTYETKFTVASETAALYTKSITVSKNSISTLYLIGTSNSFDGLLVSDETTNVSNDKAYVRFINVSPDATALDLGIKDATSNLASNKAFKAYSEFVAVEPGTKVFEIKEATTPNIKATVEKTLVKGGFYTILAGGKVTPSNDLEKPFNGQILTHQ